MSKDQGEPQVVIKGAEFNVLRRVEQAEAGLVWLDVEPTKWQRVRRAVQKAMEKHGYQQPGGEG